MQTDDGAFTVTVANDNVAVVTLQGSPSMTTWDDYVVAYSSLYLCLKKFVLVFDIRAANADMNMLLLIAKKAALVRALKPLTVCQVISTVVVTTNATLVSQISILAKQNGQTSPLYFVDTPEAAARKVARGVCAIRGWPCPLWLLDEDERAAFAATPRQLQMRVLREQPLCIVTLSVVHLLRTLHLYSRSSDTMTRLRNGTLFDKTT